MNNFKSLMLTTTALLLLSGCGSEDSGSSPVSKYTLQFVTLDVVDDQAVNSNCEVYGREEIYNPDSSTDESTDSTEPDSVNVVIAQKLSGASLLTVYVQDSTGAVLDTYTSQSANWSNDGELNIVTSKVPNNGFVTIAREVVGNSVASVDALTIQKSLLQSKMMINTVFNEGSAATCVQKATQPTVYTKTGAIDQNNDGLGIFGFSTPEGIFQSFSGQSIELKSPNKTFLATRHVRESDDTAGEIQGYRFVTLTQMSEDSPIELKEMTNSDLLWTAPQDMTTSSAEINIYKSGTGSLHWQLLPTTGTGSYGYASEVGNNYFASTQGTYNLWDVNQTQRMTSPSVSLDLSNRLTSQALPGVVASELVSCSTSAVGRCLQTYTDSGATLNAQRTLASVSSAGREIRQVIYSAPQSLIPMTSFNNSTLDGLWSSDLSLTEVSLLMGTTNSEVKQIFTEQNFDGFAVVNQTFNAQSFTDGISIVRPRYVQKEDKDFMKYTDNLQLQHREVK